MGPVPANPVGRSRVSHDPMNDLSFSPHDGGSRPPTADCLSPRPGFVRHLLIVDDNAELREVLATVLRYAGYRITSAADGEGGWEAFCGSSFDGLITDYEMPGMDGLALIRRIRAGSIEFPVILISGAMPWQHPGLEQLLAPGMPISKPFQMAPFLVSVREIFGRPLRADTRSCSDGARGCARSMPPSQATPRGVQASAFEHRVAVPRGAGAFHLPPDARRRTGSPLPSHCLPRG